MNAADGRSFPVPRLDLGVAEPPPIGITTRLTRQISKELGMLQQLFFSGPLVRRQPPEAVAAIAVVIPAISTA